MRYFEPFKSWYLRVYPYVLITIVSVAVCHKILFSSGLIMFGDLVFPFPIGREIDRVFPMWNEFGSYSTFLRCAHLPPVMLAAGIASFFHLTMGTFAKLSILFGFILIGSSMYCAAYSILKEYGKSERVAFIASLITSFVYMFNFWSLNRIQHSWLWWMAYALTPILILCFMKALKTHRFIYVVMTSILWVLISSHSTYAIFAGMLILSWLIFSIIYQAKTITRSEVLSYFKTTGLVLALFLAFSAYWLVPDVISGLQSGHVAPTAPPAMLSVDEFSRNSLNGWFLDTFRLMGFPDPSLIESYQPASQSLRYLWTIASFILPIFAFAALFLTRKNKHILYFSSMALVFVFLNMGTHGSFGSFYDWLVHKIPFFSDQFGRIFRDPDRWGGLTALCYCFLIGFTVAEILQRGWKKPLFNWRKLLSVGMVVVFILSFALSVMNPVSGYLGHIYVPVQIPNEYQRVNSWLGEQKEDFKVWWLPNYAWRNTTWGSQITGSLCSFDIWSSAKPTLWDPEQQNPATYNYIHYTYDSLLYDNVTQWGKYLTPINTRYVIFHKDIIGAEEEIDTAISNLEKQNDLEFVKQDGIYYIFENKNYAPHVFVPSQNLLISGGLNMAQRLNAIDTFDPASSSQIYLDQAGLEELPNTGGIVLGPGNSVNDIALSQVADKYLITPASYTDRWKPDTYWSSAMATADLYWDGALYANWVPNPWEFDYGKEMAVTWDYRTDLNQAIPHTILTNDVSVWQSVSWTSSDYIQINSDGESLAMNYSFDNQNSVQVFAQNISPFSLEDWSNYDTISAQVYGDGSGNEFEFWYRMNNDDTNGWQIGSCVLDWTGWKEVTFTFSGTLKDKVHRFVTVVNWDKNKSPDGLGSHEIKVKDIKMSSSGLSLSRHTLDTPLKAEKNGLYDLYARVLKNVRGGKLTFSIDGNEVGILDTVAKTSNFIWEKVGTLALEKGNHTLMLQNTYGFNTVNLIAAIPQDVAKEYFDSVYSIIDGKRISHILSCATDLDYYGGQVSDSPNSSTSGSKVLILNGPSETFVQPFSLKKDDTQYWQTVPWTSFDHIQISSDGESLAMNYSFDNQNSVQVFAQNISPFSLEDWSNYDTLSAQVYGDGSGNELEFWYRMNNDETKGWQIGSCVLDWTGWKEVFFTFPAAPRDKVHRFVTVVNWDENKSPDGLDSHEIRLKDITLSLEYPSEANSTIHVLKDGQYKIALKAFTGSDYKSIIMQIGDVKSELDLTSNGGLRWVYSKSIFLTKGDYTLNILPKGKTIIDTIMVYSTDNNENLVDIFQAKDNPATISSWDTVSTTEYKVHIDAQSPFILAFAEAYDPFWVAKIGGKEYKSLPLYSVINGFSIDKTGNLDIVINYKPQHWFYYGAMISGASFLSALVCLIWSSRRKNPANDKGEVEK